MKRRREFLAAIVGSVLLTAADAEIAQQAVPQGLAGLTFIEPPLLLPRLTAQNKDGGRVDTGSIYGTPFVMNLWARWCTPCVIELPSLQRMSMKTNDRFKVVLVNQDAGGAAVALPFLSRLGVTEPSTLFDPQGRLSRSLSVRGLPTTFLGDGLGRLTARFEGAAEWDDGEVLDFVKLFLA